MRLESFKAIVTALDRAGVKYLVAGGIAVNAFGFLRQTKDADLVVQLSTANVSSLFSALASIGYRPVVPITAEQFGDVELRDSLVRDKNMRVLQFFSDEHRETPVDVFAFEPFNFDEEYSRCVLKTLAGTAPVRFVALRTLIRMKEAVGRTQDLVDVEQLKLLVGDDEETS